MKRNRAFSVTEIVIVLVIIGLIAALAGIYYRGTLDKAKISAAKSTMQEIGKAETLHKINEGDFVAAGSTEEIRQSLPVSVDSKYYDYRIVGVTDDEFMVLASKIGTGQIVLAMNQNGIFQNEPGAGGTGTGSGGQSAGGGGSSGGGGGTGSGGGGSSGGGGGTGEAILGGGGSSGPAIVPSAGGGWSDGSEAGTNENYIEPDLLGATHLLRDSTYASYAYDIITDKLINVKFVSLSVLFGPSYADAGAVWTGLEDPLYRNTIYVNTLTMQGASDAAIAAVVAHEATHADYDYYGVFWTSATYARHPELEGITLSLPADSVLQEYDCMTNSCETWKELKTGSNDFNDGWLEAYEQGTLYFWDAVKTSYWDLPDY